MPLGLPQDYSLEHPWLDQIPCSSRTISILRLKIVVSHVLLLTNFRTCSPMKKSDHPRHNIWYPKAPKSNRNIPGHSSFWELFFSQNPLIHQIPENLVDFGVCPISESPL
jgi:hypothetical protein